jgi:hypothetical protein
MLDPKPEICGSATAARVQGAGAHAGVKLWAFRWLAAAVVAVLSMPAPHAHAVRLAPAVFQMHAGLAAAAVAATSVTDQPAAGLIAYTGRDGNIWTINPDGTDGRQVTTDGSAGGLGGGHPSPKMVA